MRSFCLNIGLGLQIFTRHEKNEEIHRFCAAHELQRGSFSQAFFDRSTGCNRPLKLRSVLTIATELLRIFASLAGIARLRKAAYEDAVVDNLSAVS
jgi:hypothetical protein